MGDIVEKIDDKTVKLYLGGISASWTNEYLKGLLSEHGAVKRVDIVKHYAFAFAETQDAAEKIIAGVSGKTFDGHRLVVQISKNKQNLPDCEDLCFECGKPGHWAKECKQRRDRYARSGPPGGRGRGGPSARRGTPYARPPPGRYPPSGREYGYDRDPYGRSAYARDPYGRGDPYGRDPYGRDPYGRDPYSRDPYARDPYARDPYGIRDPYAYQTPAQYDYRERSPTGARYAAAAAAAATTVDPYAEERRRLAYGASASAPVEHRDPYTDPYARKPDPYQTPAARPVDPYATSGTGQYSYPPQ